MRNNKKSASACSADPATRWSIDVGRIGAPPPSSSPLFRYNAATETYAEHHQQDILYFNEPLVDGKVAIHTSAPSSCVLRRPVSYSNGCFYDDRCHRLTKPVMAVT